MNSIRVGKVQEVINTDQVGENERNVSNSRFHGKGCKNSYGSSGPPPHTHTLTPEGEKHVGSGKGGATRQAADWILCSGTTDTL